MGNKLYKEEHIQAIAAAIRAKIGGAATYTVAQMADAIASIKTAAILQKKTVTPNSTTQNVTADNGFDGLESVTVDPVPTQKKTATENGIVTPDSGKYLSEVEVNVPVPTPSYDTPSITVSSGGLITASANGKSNTQQLSTQAGKTVTPTKAQQQAVASGRYTTGIVLVDKIPDQYIIPSGSETKTQNGTYDVTSLAELVVNVSGGGGLPAGIAAFDFGKITVSTAFTTTRQTFNHKLGVIPDLMIVWAPSNIATTYSMLFAIRGTQVNWRGGNYSGHMAYHGNSTSTVTWTNANSTSYGISNMTATTFQLASASSSYYWRAGTYNYIAIKFS